MIYLDSAATTLQKPPEVAVAAARAIRRLASPGRGGHRPAMEAARLAFSCREEAAALFRVPTPEQVVFTASATHGLNLAIQTLVRPGARVALSGYEHNAVTRPLHALGAQLLVARAPLFQPEAMAAAFRAQLDQGAEAAVCTHVSNVFGYALPLDEIAPLLTAAGVPLILDASQSAGVVPLDVSRYPCLAAVCMPGHKALYGPMGTGVLLALDERLASRPLMAGGTGSQSEEMAQPDFLPDAQESGTPNVPGLAGLAAGIQFVRSVGPENILAHERRLAQETARALEGNGLLEVFSNPAQTGVLSVRFRDIPAESAAEQLARQGIAVRAGLHCAPLAHRTAGTEQTGTVRLSFGFYSTAGQAEQAAKAFKLVKKL